MELNNIEKNGTVFDELEIARSAELIIVKGKQNWQTLSSAVLGGGFSTHDTFVNRHVDKDYHSDDPVEEFRSYLHHIGIKSDVLAMMTAAKLEDAVIIRSHINAPSILVIISAGVGNAVDVSKAYTWPSWEEMIGTINTWVFIDGTLPKSAYIQAIITATEAKAKALFDESIRDSFSKTLATGTSTDSVLIAATQTGPDYPYAGTITTIGKEIGKLVYEGTRETLRNYKMRVESDI